MSEPRAPRWAKQDAERVETKAAHVAALYILRRDGNMPRVPKTQLAEALGISRWTLDRYLASLPEVERIVGDVLRIYAAQE